MHEQTDDYGNRWLVSEEPVSCYLCTHEWRVAVPVGIKEAECPNCGHMNSLDILLEDDDNLKDPFV